MIKGKLVILLLLIISRPFYAQITSSEVIIEHTDDITLKLEDKNKGKIKILNGQLQLGEYIDNNYQNLSPSSYLTLDVLGNLTQSNIQNIEHNLQKIIGDSLCHIDKNGLSIPSTCVAISSLEDGDAWGVNGENQFLNIARSGSITVGSNSPLGGKISVLGNNNQLHINTTGTGHSSIYANSDGVNIGALYWNINGDARLESRTDIFNKLTTTA